MVVLSGVGMNVAQIIAGSSPLPSGSPHRSYCKAAWSIAPLWSALVLLLPGIRANLYTGLNFRGMEPSWWRAGIAAVAVGLLFVALTAVLRRAILSHTPGRRALAAVGGLLTGFWIFSSLFVMVCVVQRDGWHHIATARSVPMYLYVWPLTGLVATILTNQLAWIVAVVLALYSVRRLNRVAGSKEPQS